MPSTVVGSGAMRKLIERLEILTEGTISVKMSKFAKPLKSSRTMHGVQVVPAQETSGGVMGKRVKKDDDADGFVLWRNGHMVGIVTPLSSGEGFTGEPNEHGPANREWETVKISDGKGISRSHKTLSDAVKATV